MAKYSKKAQDKIEDVMHEYKRGQLKSGKGGKGGKVKNRKQAIAIGISEAREEGAKVPPKKTGRKKMAAKPSRKTAGKRGPGRPAGKTSARKTLAKKSASRKSSVRKSHHGPGRPSKK